MYIKRDLNDKLTTFKNSRFPYKAKKHRPFRYSVTVGIGGNMGDVKKRFEHLFFEINKDKRVTIKTTSLVLKNPPFGYIDQDDFFNSIMVLKTSMLPHKFLDYLMRLERKFGRRRSFANAPRTLDLDIIFLITKLLTQIN